MMRAYDWLLHLYPASFRAEYGADMRAIFARDRRDVSGARELALFWIRVIADVVANASRVHGDILRQDVRHGLRVLGRAPGFTATAVVLAALGTGATTVAFSLADHVLIRPVRFPEADRLVRLWEDQSFLGYPEMELSPGNYRDWKRGSTSFEAMAAYTESAANLVGAGEPQRLEGALATSAFFTVLRAKAASGRVFTEAEAGTDCTTVISHGLWHATYNADPSAIGRKMVLNGEPCAIIGVMPANFDFPSPGTRFWRILRFDPGGVRRSRQPLPASHRATETRCVDRWSPGRARGGGRRARAAVSQGQPADGCHGPAPR